MIHSRRSLFQHTHQIHKHNHRWFDEKTSQAKMLQLKEKEIVNSLQLLALLVYLIAVKTLLIKHITLYGTSQLE